MRKNIFFDEVKWYTLATTQADWYKIIYPEFEAILVHYEGGTPQMRKAARNAVYGFFEQLLSEGKVILGATGKNWDSERKPVDTIVIHHTKGEGGITWERLSAMHLLRLYAKSYFAPSTEKDIQGLPIYSHHFREASQKDPGKPQMVFYAYHWLVKSDGSAQRLLSDSAIGWQAGNWDINCRSVGICLDGNFEHAPPPSAMILGVQRLIHEHYPHIASDRIIPHRKANPKTTCPGEWFEGVTGK